MDALAAEIAKKRKQVDGAKGGDAKRRWVRTADLQQQRRKDVEASAARKPVARPVVVEEAPPTTPKDDDRIEERVKALTKLPQGDVIKRLRQLGQPVTLFGETDSERIRRLAIHDPRNEGEDDFRLRGGHEITETKDTKEEKDDEEDLTDDFSRIRSWIKARLKAWESALESRSDADKRSAQGRLKTKTYKQTKEYIRPLTRWRPASRGAVTSSPGEQAAGGLFSDFEAVRCSAQALQAQGPRAVHQIFFDRDDRALRRGRVRKSK
jgi:pre-mRNA-splicing factor 18